MEHKAFAFNWNSFEQELFPTLVKALETGEVQEIINFIEKNRQHLTDPYEGQPLDDGWQSTLSNRDVHEYGDYALTKYYAPDEAAGVGDAWIDLSDELPATASRALLGETVGPKGNLFDPGRMGSYFQRPEQARVSLDVLTNLNKPELADFCQLLSECVNKNLGVYITF